MSRWDEDQPSLDLPFDGWHHIRMVCTFGGALAVLSSLSKDPLWVENIYVDGVGHRIADALADASGLFPFSLAELALLVGVVLLLLGLVKALGSFRSGRSFVNRVAHGLLGVVDLALVVLVWFYLGWGVCYARPNLVDRLGLDVAGVDAPTDAAEKARLASLFKATVARVDALYAQIHGSADDGTITAPAKGVDVDGEIESAYAVVGQVLQEPEWFGERRPRAKKPFLSSGMSWVGVAGVYVPFTGEATVDAGPPAWSLVFTTAHEKAHQRMVGPEDEANFFGFLACIHSSDPVVQYAGWQMARAQFYRAYYAVDPDAAEAIEQTLGPGVKRDIAEVALYWEKYEGPLRHVQQTINDFYLKANHVQGGVRAYDHSTRILAAWLDTAHGKALLAGEQPVVK